MFEADILSKLIALEHDVNKLKTLDGLDSTVFGRPVFVTNEYVSQTLDGTGKSSNATAIKLDLSTDCKDSNNNYVPNGVKAILCRFLARDSATLGTNNLSAGIGPEVSKFYAATVYPPGGDIWASNTCIVPCDSNGDIYYRLVASGSGTMDVWLQIWGYWL